MAITQAVARMQKFMKLADRMLERASKETLAEAIRILALEVAHYQHKHGLLPEREAINLLDVKNLTDEQATWVADGFENIAAVLADLPDNNAGASVH